MARGNNFARRLLLAIDEMSYGSGDDQQQIADQDGLRAALDEAAAEAHLRRPTWTTQPAGDGELAILPPAEPEPRVVDDFVRKLAAALQHHNRALLPERRLRLRLAIHHGSAAPASNGFFGQGVVVVNRLVDSPVLRAALAASDADLAVILSRQVYTDTVVQGYTSFDPADFRKIRVRNKEFSEDAWIWVSRGDVHALDLSDNPARRHLPAPLPRRRSNGARNVIIAALLAALVTSGVVASARLWNRGAPLRFEVVGSCTSAGGTLGNRSSGFTPGGHYRTTAAYPDGRPYTNFLLGAVGTASRDESVSWSWDCQGDPPGTYWTQLTDEATGRSTGRVPFTIGSPPQP